MIECALHGSKRALIIIIDHHRSAERVVAAIKEDSRRELRF